jgi:predicted nucleic acid-binding protein
VTPELFLDTVFVVALAVATDQYHAGAKRLAQIVRTAGSRLVTTRAVLLEVGNALGKRQFRSAAVRLLSTFEADPNVTIVPLSDELYASALDLYRRRPDKDWGLIDCASFVVMRERGLTEALTADEHFEQAGFAALLRHDPA